MDIKESDWKVFRKLRELAPEGYCERVLNEVRQLVEKKRAGSHERYLKLWDSCVSEIKHSGTLLMILVVPKQLFS